MTSQNRNPERPFAEAVLNDAEGGHIEPVDSKALRAAQASVRLDRWRRRKGLGAASEAGTQGGSRIETSLRGRQTSRDQ